MYGLQEIQLVINSVQDVTTSKVAKHLFLTSTYVDI